jgi:hypothetical protein
MIAAMLTAVTAAIVLSSALFTLSQYDRLPDRVPLHFGFNGSANQFGPRWTAWLLVGLQLAIALSGFVDSGRLSLSRLAFNVAIVGICAWTQLEIVSAAVNGSNRIRTGRFVVVVIALLIAGSFAARWIG